MKQIHKLLFFLFLVTISCGQKNSKPITAYAEGDVKNSILVDVRTLKEYEAGHLPNALHMDWFDENFENKFADIDKNKTIYVYCKVGGRSAKAQEKLLSLGYKNVINLEGGYDAVLAIKK